MAQNYDNRTDEELAMEYKDTVGVFKDSQKISSRTEAMIDCKREPYKVRENLMISRRKCAKSETSWYKLELFVRQTHPETAEIALVPV